MENNIKIIEGNVLTQNERIVCPNCGCNPQDEPYCMEPTHCPKCGYTFGMYIREEEI